MTLAFFDDHRTNLSRHDECLINSSSLFSTLLTANTTVINIYFHYLLHLWKFLLEVTFTWAGRTEINFHYSFFSLPRHETKRWTFHFLSVQVATTKKKFCVKRISCSRHSCRQIVLSNIYSMRVLDFTHFPPLNSFHSWQNSVNVAFLRIN